MPHSRREAAKYDLTWRGRRATIKMSVPRRLRGGGYACEIGTTGMPSLKQNLAVGGDALQAIFRALAIIVKHLQDNNVHPQDNAGKWLQYTLPIPLMETELLGQHSVKRLRDVIKAYCRAEEQRKPRIARKRSG